MPEPVVPGKFLSLFFVVKKRWRLLFDVFGSFPDKNLITNLQNLGNFAALVNLQLFKNVNKTNTIPSLF